MNKKTGVISIIVIAVIIVGGIAYFWFELGRKPTEISTPTGLTATTPSAGEIKLDWDDNPENDLDHYNVYRGMSLEFGCDNSTFLDSTQSSEYVDTGLEENIASYYYRVTAVNDEGEESSPTPSVHVTSNGGGEPIERFFGISTKIVHNVWEGLFQDSFKWYCEDQGWDYHMLEARADPILQTEQIRHMVDMGVDGIIVSAADRDAPISALKYADGKGVPVFCTDADVDSGYVKMYVGFSGIRASRLLGEKIVEYLRDEVDPIGEVKGEVLEVRGPLGGVSGCDRHDGFMEVMDNYPGISVQTVNGQFLREEAKYMSIPKLMTTDFDAIYAANGPMLLGVIKAMETLGQDPAQKFVVGIDAMPAVLDEIRAGRVRYVFDQPCPFYNPIALYYLNKYIEEGPDALPEVGETITAEDLAIDGSEHEGYDWWETPTWAPAEITTREGHLWFQTSGVMVDENNCDEEWLWGNAEIPGW